ncbi:transposase [uncultured Roseobacter sp.]|uniref:IS110 family transposase n=1 Tax=uncultured Roseobacter sp. TaxID=114847 RepID=UPI002602C429|nr:transposase [uncultured Roseobacter sp.]
MTKHTIGVDISKDQLDIHVLPSGEAMTVKNSGHGFRKMVRWFRKLDPEIIVFEPTGSYHRAFAQAMHAAGFAIHGVNPLYARRFAQAVGILAKKRIERMQHYWLGWVLRLVCDPSNLSLRRSSYCVNWRCHDAG